MPLINKLIPNFHTIKTKMPLCKRVALFPEKIYMKNKKQLKLADEKFNFHCIVV